VFLVDLTALKLILGYAPTSTTYDAELQMYGEAAEAAVEKYCNRRFESRDYVEYYSGNNTQRIALRQTPVTAVTAVHLDSYGYYGANPDSPFGATTLLSPGVDYVLDEDAGGVSKSGVLIRIGTVWPVLNRVLPNSRLAPEIGPAVGNVKVEYTAGYAEAPADLKMATAMVAVNMRQIARRGGDKVRQEKIGDYAYTLFDRLVGAPELGSVRATLSSYKEYGW